MKTLEKALRKMCEVVGAEYESVDFNNNADPYFWKQTWTKDQEGEFTAWLADYLYTDKEARNEFMQFPAKNKKLCQSAAYWFVWNHGWKVCDD